MACWILKTEPEAFSWSDLVRDGKTIWDGVRNFQARNNLRSMQKGDAVLIYHSVSDKALVGIATVSKAAFADPTFKEKPNPWLVVEVKPVKAIKPVSLDTIKKTSSLKNLKLITQSRLSVVPVSKTQWGQLLKLSAAGKNR